MSEDRWAEMTSGDLIVRKRDRLVFEVVNPPGEDPKDGYRTIAGGGMVVETDKREMFEEV